MRGPETPTVLLKASDRLSRSRIWDVVHHRYVQEPAVVGNEQGEERERFGPPMSVRLGERGTPVPAPRRPR